MPFCIAFPPECDVSLYNSESLKITILMSQRFATDILVAGGGAAGLPAALHLADFYRVTLLSKGSMESEKRQIGHKEE